MFQPDCMCLLCSSELVSLIAISGNEEQLRYTDSLPSGSSTLRFDLALYAVPEIVIRVPGHDRTPFRISEDGGCSFLPVEAVPGDTSLERNRCRAHNDRIFTVIEEQLVWVRYGMLANWQQFRLPPSFQAHDASVDGSGRIYVAGSLPSSRLVDAYSEAALAQLERDLVEIVRIPLSSKDKRLLEDGGGAEAFRRVYADAEPIVVTSDCAWLFDDPSSFALIAHTPVWVVRRLRGQSVKCVTRNYRDEITIYCYEGSRHRMRTGTLAWNHEDLLPAIRGSIVELSRYSAVVNAADAREKELALGVTFYESEGHGHRKIAGCAILTSTDDGRTFQVRLLRMGPSWAVCGVTLYSS